MRDWLEIPPQCNSGLRIQVDKSLKFCHSNPYIGSSDGEMPETSADVIRRNSVVVRQFNHEVRFFGPKSEKRIRVFLLRNVPLPQQLHPQSLRIKPAIIFRKKKVKLEIDTK